MRNTWIAAFLGVLIAIPAVASAQGIDCSRARSPTEKAICASPALLSLDHQVAAAYADAQARTPDRRDAMRSELIAWLRQRDATCNVPAAAIERCLSGQLTARLAALAPPAPQAAVTAPPVAPAPPPATPVILPDPAIPPPSANPPVPAARLDASSLPAADEADTLLHVTSPGRFTIAAHSPSGAGLQLVDMLTGPSDIAGVAGSQDGRLDQLLDIGTYKIRVFSAAGATGAVPLSVVPFHDAAPPAALPPPGRPLASELRDGEQRAFWLLVPPGDGPNVRIEAAGRSLADLRLWRDGRELTALDPVRQRVEPAPGHPIDDLRLGGHVEPGTYLAIAYGGPAVPWTDGANTQPFLLRAGASDTLADGWAGGTIGPFGSEVFALPPYAKLLRLDLPAAAPAELRVADGVAAIAKNNRVPAATLTVVPGTQQVVEVRGAAGQAYTLRAEEQPADRNWSRAGTWWMSAVTTGMGGDEAPPAVLLQRNEGADKPPRIIASTAPKIGAGAPWHARFNLRGPTDLLFQVTSGGDVAFSSTGVPVRHGRAGLLNVPADFYMLHLFPQTGALGGLDLIVGQPGPAAPAVAQPLPADPVIPLGLQVLAPGQSVRLDGSDAPDATIGLSVRRSPVALAEGPLVQTIAAGTSLSIPVVIAPGGTLVVTELGSGATPFGQQDDTTPGRTTVVIPVSDHPRTVALAWRRTPAPLAAIPPPPPPGQVAAVQAGTPVYLDLRRNEERGFALSVPEGGLFRIETLGRLHTAGRLATPFIPNLADADGNGVGQNLLMQNALRAGQYRVDVRAVDSAGHLGLVANPAPLLSGGTLRAGGSVRATLAGGAGVRFPIEVTGKPDQRYRFDVLSLGKPWTGRIEDAEGWPVVPPGPLDGIEAALRPGRYALVLAPAAVPRTAVARLTAITKPVATVGHGPHPLGPSSTETATWREPDGRGQPRTPDTWTFSVAGPTDVTITLSDGMTGDLRREGSPDVIARVTPSWQGSLDAGDYVLDAISLGRNDRLAYTVHVESTALQDGETRRVDLPASVPFSLGEAQVVSLTSWGSVPVQAILRTEDGSVIGRFGARADDWNVAVSRLLPAGQYRLDLKTAAPPNMSSRASAAPPAGDNADSGDTPGSDDQTAQTPPGQPASAADAAPDDAPAANAADSADAPETSAPHVDVHLALPDELPPAAAPQTLSALEGSGVHTLTLPAPSPGSLIVARAEAASATVLALERQTADDWQTVAIGTGTAPVAAAMADGNAAAWRLQAWSVDAGPDAIRLAARVITAAAQDPGRPAMAAIDGMDVAAARVHLPGPGLVTISSSLPGLLAGGWAGHALDQATATEATDTTELWLLAPQPGSVTVAPVSFAPGATIAAELPAGLPAALPPIATDDAHLALWRVASGSGQPSLGLSAGVADGSGVALAGAPVTVRTDSRQRLRVTRLIADMVPARPVDAALQATVAPLTALPVTLPPGNKTVQLDLASGLAAFAGDISIWTGDAAVSRTIEGDWTRITLVNTGGSAAAARVSAQPAPPTAPLQPGMAIKRFYGAAGSFALPVAAPEGSHLRVTGDASLLVATEDKVATGANVSLSGKAEAIVQHGPGALVMWLDAPGTSPWPEAAAQAVTLPARMPLSGATMALGFTAATPALLHVSTTAPVLASLQNAPPALFPAGAELHRAVAAGPVTLRLFSADDGPLTGTVTAWAEPLTPIGEGLGQPVTVAPGGTAAFAFSLTQAATVGLGVRSNPDRATLRLLDGAGAVVGEGVAQLRQLPPGNYVMEASVPPDAQPTSLQAALVGVTPRGNGPPPDVVQHYLELVGMKPQGTP